MRCCPSRAPTAAPPRSLGQRFELPYEPAGKTVKLVVDPHAQRVVGVENDDGESLGAATLLDEIGNARRTRRKAEPVADSPARGGPNLVEIAHRQYHSLKED